MIPTKTRLQYANGYLELGMINEASEEIESIVGEDRMSLAVMSFRMKMYRQAEYWPALEAVSKHIAKMAPRKPDGWINYAHALKEMGKIEDAKEVASKALARHPNTASLWFSLGRCYSLLGETKEASEHVKIESIVGEDRMSLAVMSFRMKMYRQAEYWPALGAVSKHIAKRAPRKPDGWINYAHTLKEMGKIENAKEVASKALKRHPNNASLWFSLGCCCSLLGETKEASDHVKKATQLDKTLQKASVDHPDLDNLWKSIASI